MTGGDRQQARTWLTRAAEALEQADLATAREFVTILEALAGQALGGP